MKRITKILSTEKLTHDVIRFVAEKPEGLQFKPGQAIDVSINKKDWEDELRPFTFTSLPEEKDIEFVIKIYPDHKGVTNELSKIGKGDEIIIHDVFGDIGYKDDGIFIAGGAGVTPFIAIFKWLEKEGKIGNNKLIFANKTKKDIILYQKFSNLLGDNFINVLSDEKAAPYEHGYVTAELIKKHMEPGVKYYYLCGPDPMMDAVEKHFKTLNIDSKFIVKEGF